MKVITSFMCSLLLLCAISHGQQPVPSTAGNGTLTIGGVIYDVTVSPQKPVTPPPVVIPPSGALTLPKLMMSPAWPLNQPATQYPEETRLLNSSFGDGQFTPKPIKETFFSNFGVYHLHFDNTIRITIVDTSKTPEIFTPVTITENWTKAFDPSHIPVLGCKIEGGDNAVLNGDRHCLIYDVATKMLYELFGTKHNADGSYTAAAFTPWDTTKAVVLPNGQTSADAAGLPILPLMLRYSEALTGTISHAIRTTMNFTRANNSDGGFVSPASHAAGNNWSSMAVEGQRFYLRKDFPTTGLPAIEVTVINAMKTYGLVVADNGSTGYVTMDNDSRWDMDAMTVLGNSIHLSDFILVNSGPIIDASGAAIQ